MRLGVLGGTFDPIHVAHLVAGVNARHALELDLVLFVVANEPWQKVGGRQLTPAGDRLAVTEAALEGADGMRASSMEIERGGTSYTADTLAELRAADPDADLFLIVGADVARELHTWARVEEVRAAAALVVVDRPGSPLPVEELRAVGWAVERVTIPLLEISSTEVRERVAAGLPLDYLVPEPAIRCIRERGLYAGGR